MAYVAIDDDGMNATILGAVDVVEEIDFKTKKQKLDPKGRGLIWKIILNVRAPVAPDAEFTPRPEMLDVKVPYPSMPEIVPGVAPQFGGWRGNTWNNGDKGGTGFAADTVAMSGPPSETRTRSTKTDKTDVSA